MPKGRFVIGSSPEGVALLVKSQTKDKVLRGVYKGHKRVFKVEWIVVKKGVVRVVRVRQTAGGTASGDPLPGNRHFIPSLLRIAVTPRAAGGHRGRSP
jgi:hypothetical protein